MSNMYNQKVIDIFANPQNAGSIPDADGVGTVGNAACGDIMKMYLKIDNNVITDAKFQTFGCAAAIATSSLAATLITGKTIEEAEKLTNRQVVEELGGLPPQKIHCSVLAEEAIKKAIEDYRSRAGGLQGVGIESGGNVKGVGPAKGDRKETGKTAGKK